MSTDSSTQSQASEPAQDAIEDRLSDLEERLSALETTTNDDERKMAIIATKGSLDMAYPPLILATTAAAFDYDVTVFYTFWGLDVLHETKSKQLQLSGVGNPSLPIPNALGVIPGMDRVTTKFMNRQIAANNTATIEDLIETALDMGVDLQACQMTMDLLDYDEDALYDGVTSGVGAATAVQDLAEADIQLLV